MIVLPVSARHFPVLAVNDLSIVGSPAYACSVRHNPFSACSMTNVVTRISGVLYSALTTRVIFNLRLVAKQGSGVLATELYERDEDLPMGPLTFLPGPGDPEDWSP